MCAGVEGSWTGQCFAPAGAVRSAAGRLCGGCGVGVAVMLMAVSVLLQPVFYYVRGLACE